MGLVGGLGRQAVDNEVFGRAAIEKAFAKVDLDPTDPTDPLHAGKLSFAFLQGTMSLVPLARDFGKVLPQPFRDEAFGLLVVQSVRTGHEP
jgi:hypothetical protein